MAILALIVAFSGSAFAGPVAQLARLVSGDKLIKKGTLSGNRLRAHTLTGRQLALSKLGTVPRAGFAASSASATNAQHAVSADNATSLAGQPVGSFQQRVRWAIVDSSGVVTAQSGGITNDAHDPPTCTPGCDSLNFGSSQVGRAILVTPNAAGQENAAFLCGGTANPGGVDCGVGGDINHIEVESFTSAGAFTNGDYFIAVIG